MAVAPEAAGADAALMGADAPELAAAASDFAVAGVLALLAAPVGAVFGAFAGGLLAVLPVALLAALAAGLFGAAAGFAVVEPEVAFDADPAAAPGAALGVGLGAAFGAALAGAAPGLAPALAADPAPPASAATALVDTAHAPLAHASASIKRTPCIRRKELRRASVPGFTSPFSPSGRCSRPVTHRRTFSVTTVSSTAQSGTKVAYRARREGCMQ
jgi:hypothetical protein